MSAVPVPKSRRDLTAIRHQWVERLDRFRPSCQTVVQICDVEEASFSI